MSIYIVWGPSAEWGDGQGVIGYASSKEDAQAILEQEKQDEKEYGPRSWRTVDDAGDIEEIPVEEFLKHVNEKARRVFKERGINGLVEYLNESL